jgi:hypothetical protein
MKKTQDAQNTRFTQQDVAVNGGFDRQKNTAVFLRRKCRVSQMKPGEVSPFFRKKGDILCGSQAIWPWNEKPCYVNVSVPYCTTQQVCTDNWVCNY